MNTSTTPYLASVANDGLLAGRELEEDAVTALVACTATPSTERIRSLSAGLTPMKTALTGPIERVSSAARRQLPV